jgi:hypothetical protein
VAASAALPLDDPEPLDEPVALDEPALDEALPLDMETPLPEPVEDARLVSALTAPLEPALRLDPLAPALADCDPEPPPAPAPIAAVPSPEPHPEGRTTPRGSDATTAAAIGDALRARRRGPLGAPRVLRGGTRTKRSGGRKSAHRSARVIFDPTVDPGLR